MRRRLYPFMTASGEMSQTDLITVQAKGQTLTISKCLWPASKHQLSNERLLFPRLALSVLIHCPFRPVLFSLANQRQFVSELNVTSVFPQVRCLSQFTGFLSNREMLEKKIFGISGLQVALTFTPQRETENCPPPPVTSEER